MNGRVSKQLRRMAREKQGEKIVVNRTRYRALKTFYKILKFDPKQDRLPF